MNFIEKLFTKYFNHEYSNNISISMKIESNEFFETKFQKINFINNNYIFINNEIQLGLDDEHYYHESLVHPAMITHKNPQSVLIIGGGDGMTLREVLKHSEVEKAVLIDIDEDFVNWCKNKFNYKLNGAFYNTRSKIIFGDAFVEIEKLKDKFDVIIIDLVTIMDDELFNDKSNISTLNLYSNDFYLKCKGVLKDNGILVTQSHSLSLIDNIYKKHLFINDQLKKIFKNINTYTINVESFLGTSSFIICSDSINSKTLNKISIEKIKKIENDLKLYDENFHNVLFYLNKDQQEILR